MKLTRKLTSFGAAALLVAGSLASAETDVVATRTSDIVETAGAAGSFKTLLAAAQAAGLVETLKAKGPFTVFAPTDAAFARLPAGTVEALLKDKEALRAILTYHVVAGSVPASKVATMRWAPTVQGQSVLIRTGKSGVQVDGAMVVKADIHASNGIIHVIDKVILPRADVVDTAVKAGSFGTLVAAVQAAELVETLKGKGPFTVFAPTDAAFAKLPEGTVAGLLKDKARLRAILTYHVVSGRVLSEAIAEGTSEVATVAGGKLRISRDKNGVMINGAKVVKADIIAGNGVIHVLDAVVLPK
ncbi:MAG: fasciclin domain-containing protein [Planctomycetota bacterium]|jgi:uncharacterized surface protein with fasciclin (FAS1) repeats